MGWGIDGGKYGCHVEGWMGFRCGLGWIEDDRDGMGWLGLTRENGME